MKERNRMIVNELKRAVSEKKSLILLLIGIGIAISHFAMYGPDYANGNKLIIQHSFRMVTPKTVYDSWMGAGTYSLQSNLYYMILPLLVSGAYADTLFVEKKSGYIKNALVRENRTRYLKSKLITVFIVGGAIFVIPLLINFGLFTTVLPLNLPQISGGSPIRGTAMLSDLFHCKPFLYIVVFLIIDFVYAGLIACLSMLTAYYIEHRFFVYATPFVTWMFINSVCGMMQKSDWSPVYFLNPGSGMAKGVVVICFLALLIVVTAIVVIKNRRNDVL